MVNMLTIVRSIRRPQLSRANVFLPALIAACVAVIALISADYLRLGQLRAEERSSVSAQLAAISSRLQINLIGEVKLLQGFAAGIVVDPEMDQSHFSSFAAQVLQSDPRLKTVAAAPGMVIKWVYPEKGNETLIGLDYRRNETQREGAVTARDTHNVVLVGPVELRKGGMGFIIRCPVYVAAGKGQAFWGILSGVIDSDQLYADSGLNSTDLDIAVSTRPNPKSADDVFLGSPETFVADPAILSLDMSYGQWTLAAAPKGGWGQKDNLGVFHIFAAALVICIVGPMIWAGNLAKSRQRTILKLRKRERELDFARRNLEHQSLHDPLTALPNRRFMDQLLSSPQDKGFTDRLAIIHVDLDGFKEVNDTKGHASGDEVLRITASRLRSVIGHQDVAARIGGDEFVVTHRSKDPEFTAPLLAQKIIQVLCAPLLIDGTKCQVGASAGVAWELEPGDGSSLLKNADLALYEAKQNGRGRAEIFTAKLHIAFLNSKQQADDLTRALEQGEMIAYFQPQFDAATLDLAGVEALARWDHPQRGILTPDKFLDVADDLGKSGDLDRVILHRAMSEMARWQALGLTVPRVSVNISARRLADKNLLAELSNLSLQPGRLCFELLETIQFDGQDFRFDQVVNQIKALGIDIEIDDFGTGHASIISLIRHQPKRLKIDRQLITPIVASASQRHLVSSIIEIGRSQGIEIVAEGVETMEHAKILRDLGCHLLQGYAFAKPMSSKQLIDFCQQDKLVHVKPAA